MKKAKSNPPNQQRVRLQKSVSTKPPGNLRLKPDQKKFGGDEMIRRSGSTQATIPKPKRKKL